MAPETRIEFQRGGEAVSRMANQRVARKMAADNVELQRRVGDRVGLRANPLRVRNGWYGEELIVKTVGVGNEDASWPIMSVARADARGGGTLTGEGRLRWGAEVKTSEERRNILRNTDGCVHEPVIITASPQHQVQNWVAGSTTRDMDKKTRQSLNKLE